MGFSKVYARKVSKADFIKQHEHHKDGFDLAKVWEDSQDKPKPKAEKVEEK